MKVKTSWGSWKKAKLYGFKPKKRTKRRVPTQAIFAAHLFNNMTPCEKKIWPALQKKGYLAQCVIVGFIPDFYHPILRVCVEIDGSVHSTERQKAKDEVKDERLRSRGYRVIRISNYRVMHDLEAILQELP